VVISLFYKLLVQWKGTITITTEWAIHHSYSLHVKKDKLQKANNEKHETFSKLRLKKDLWILWKFHVTY